MPSNYKAFETERLILRPTKVGDAGFMYELLNSPNWLKYIGDRKVYSIEAAQKHITEKILPQLERLGYANYTVIRKSDNNKMGSCGLYDREGMEGIDIGFAFLPEYEKQGYAFEAASKILQIGIEEFKITDLKAITTKENTSSQKLLIKLGLTLNDTITFSGDNEELLLYRLLPTN